MNDPLITVRVDTKNNSTSVEDQELLVHIRHQIKNKLNYLTLAEYKEYGNNDKMRDIINTIDSLLSEEYLSKHIHVVLRNL